LFEAGPLCLASSHLILATAGECKLLGRACVAGPWDEAQEYLADIFTSQCRDAFTVHNHHKEDFSELYARPKAQKPRLTESWSCVPSPSAALPLEIICTIWTLEYVY